MGLEDLPVAGIGLISSMLYEKAKIRDYLIDSRPCGPTMITPNVKRLFPRSIRMPFDWWGLSTAFDTLQRIAGLGSQVSLTPLVVIQQHWTNYPFHTRSTTHIESLFSVAIVQPIASPYRSTLHSTQPPSPETRTSP